MIQDSTNIAEQDKKAWIAPQLNELPVQETAGLGGGGPDFGSELS